MRGSNRNIIYGLYVIAFVLLVSCGGISACSTMKADATANLELAKAYKAEAVEAQRLADMLLNERDYLASEVESLTSEVESVTAAISAVEDDNESLKAQLREATKPAPKPSRSGGDWRVGKASWYGPGLYGNKTADGTRYTPETWCVAHKTLPLGTMVEIRYGGKTVSVPVKDRGPFTPGRDLDLSAAVKAALGFSGVQSVEWRVKP